MKYLLKIKVAEVGTPTNNSKSIGGHMWFEIAKINDKGDIIEHHSSGFASEHGKPIDNGIILDTDHSDYSYANQTVLINITEEQYKGLITFHKTQSYNGVSFDKANYNVAFHNCVTYTTTALQAIGLNKNGKLLSADGEFMGISYVNPTLLEISDTSGFIPVIGDIFSGAPGNVKNDIVSLLRQNGADILQISNHVSKGGLSGFQISHYSNDKIVGLDVMKNDPFRWEIGQSVNSLLQRNTNSNFIVNNAFELVRQGSYNVADLTKKDLDRAFGSRTLDFITDREALNADAKRNGKTDNTFNVSKYYPALDGYRISNYNESSDPLSVYRNNPNANSLSNLPYRSTEINRNSGWASRRLSIDPLVLDLNGDGVRLSRYSENSILFDIDNDDGSLEQTGWFSATDGVLVRDLNNNGKIDNIAEMFSEYYGGKAGSQGESGEKRYMNGFEALQ